MNGGEGDIAGYALAAVTRPPTSENRSPGTLWNHQRW